MRDRGEMEERGNAEEAHINAGKTGMEIDNLEKNWMSDS